jgi:phenylpyruvate tautomerase PptA (4-oxalocrotonate tautomerase family)
MVGLLLGLVRFISSALATLINPAPADATRIIVEEISRSSWYAALPSASQEQLSAGAIAGLWQFVVPGIPAGFLGLFVNPLVNLIIWLLFGLFAHLMGRVFGGVANLRQTLSCTALASGPQLLGCLLIFPQAVAVPLLGVVSGTLGLTQSLAISLLTMLANYVAIREAHQLAPWRAFWATILGPLFILLVLFCGYCAFAFLVVQQAG